MASGSPVHDIQHLLRLVGLIVVLAAAFLVVRAALVPDSFGEYGHYRGDALDDARVRAPAFAGRDACEECHVDVAETRAGGAHEGLGCEACHGALADHAESPLEAAAARPENVRCAVCHEANPYRPAGFPQIEIEDHAMGEACTECHDAHRPGFE